MSSITTSLNPTSRQKIPVSFARSQLVLFQSRMKWGIVYALATVAGLLLVPGAIDSMLAETNAAILVQRIVPLPMISLLITTGMFLLNDLLDVDLDRANGKKRPLPSGQVTKRQAWIFITWTNVLAVLLSAMTANYASMILVVPMLAIGIMYSAPKIALDDRFLIKTVVIALYYMLCAALGATTAYGIGLVLSSPVVFIHAAFMLGTMRFISSVLNDTGDVEGDKAAGRRTIPIVIGRENTIKMGMMIVAGMAGISWAMYALDGIGIVTASFSSAFAALMIIRLSKTVKGATDKDFIRKQHKRLLPFDLMLLCGLPIGVLLF
jgi:geranylgeranylglycerol-phosphate geranylgeranyltransferase